MTEQKQKQQVQWTKRRDEKKRRMAAVEPWMTGSLLPTGRALEALEMLVKPGDRIVMEGDNQKQADFLSRTLVKVDPKKVHGLHLIIPSISRPEHLTLFELGIAKKVDFAFAGAQSLRVAQLLDDGILEIGAVHTYVELYARLLVDLVPNVVLVLCGAGGRERKSIYRSEHRGYTGDCRGGRVSRRHCDRAGQQSRRQVAEGRYSGIVGGCRD
jgi:malonate decarboxylase alpha subunit